MSQPEPKLGSEPGFRFVWACLMGLPGVSQHEGWRKLIGNNILRQWVWGIHHRYQTHQGNLKICIPCTNALLIVVVYVWVCVGVWGCLSIHVHKWMHTSKEHCFGTKIGPEIYRDQTAPGALRTPENTGWLLYM